MTNAEARFNNSLRPRKPLRRLVRTDSPGRPPRLSHSSWTMPACSVTQATYIFNVSGNVTLTVSVNDLGFWRSFSRCSTAAAAVIQPYRSVIIFRIVSVQPSVFWGLLHFDGLSFSSVSAAKWWPKVGRPPRPLDCTSAGLPVRTAGTESVNTVRMWPFPAECRLYMTMTWGFR